MDYHRPLQTFIMRTIDRREPSLSKPGKDSVALVQYRWRGRRHRGSHVNPQSEQEWPVALLYHRP